MSDPHQKVEAFFDGRLSEEEAEAFRKHYATCDECDRRLGELMAMDVLLERRRGYAPAPAQVKKREGLLERFWWLRPSLAGGVLATAIVALVIWYQIPGSSPGGLVPPYQVVPGRSAHREAQRWRPERDLPLGAGDEQAPPPVVLLTKLEREEDSLGRAAAWLLRGKDPGEALKALGDEEGPDFDSERGFAYLVRDNAADADLARVLKYTERALQKNPRHGPALWNKALALRKLRLDLLAARTFDAVAQLGEAGWKGKAQENAAAYRHDTEETRKFAEAATEAGKKLRADGTLPDDQYVSFPDIRWYFYDAVRMRTSAEDVKKLLPLAKKLDDRSGGGTSAQRYVSWVAERDFRKRGPLATLYGKLILAKEEGIDPGPVDLEKVIGQLWGSKDNDDLAVGAMAKRPVNPRGQKLDEREQKELDEFVRRCDDLRDPWFEVLAIQRRAESLQSSQAYEAEALFEQAIRKASSNSLDFRQIRVRMELIDVLLNDSELDRASVEAAEAWKDSWKMGDWRKQLILIEQMGELARLRNDGPLARAYFEELEERTRDDKNPAKKQFIEVQLANLYANALRLDEARAHLDAAIDTGLPLSLAGALTLGDVARLRPRPAVDRQAMEAFRASLEKAALRPGERALATHALGRWKIEVDPEDGRQLLEAAIAEAAKSPTAAAAEKARAYSFTSLLMDAGRRGDFNAAMGLLERESRALPAGCVVAMAMDSERSLVVVRGAEGAVDGEYGAGGTTFSPERLDGYVTPRLLSRLERCPEVKVLARPPLFGLPGALPSQLAWSYVLPRAPETAAPPAPAGQGQHLVVQHAELSERRRKEQGELRDWVKPGDEPQATILSGRKATPSGVLGAMASADEIEIVTHSVVDPNSSEAYLVLAEDRPGQDRLRASQIRQVSLPRRPLVLLAACKSATPAPIFSTGPSLPAAFLVAGARAVLAPTEEIPIDGGPAFLRDVKARIQSGISPTVALRDVRQSWLQRVTEPDVKKWLESVLVFE